MRKIIRLLAVPLLILWWFINLFQVFLLLIACILDLNLEEFDFCIEDLFGLIKGWIKDGVNSL